MNDNTIRVDGIDIYTTKIHELADEYINTELDNPEDIKGLNKGLFTGMLKYIYLNYFKVCPLDNNNIELLDGVFNIYTSLCYKYNKRPTLLSFSIMVGISNDTFNAWKNGEYRAGNGNELGSLHSLTIKKWLRECESALVDGAIEQNGIGCIFALKANYGYTETAPMPTYNIEQRKSLDQIALEHRQTAQIEDSSKVVDVPDAEF